MVSQVVLTCMRRNLVLLLIQSVMVIVAFHSSPMTFLHRPGTSAKVSPLFSGKGFGTPPTPKKSDDKDRPPRVESASVEPITSSSSSEETLSAGKKALNQMRRAEAERRDAELRRVRSVIETDQQLRETPAAIPERVAGRMGRRALPFVGLPILGSMSAFVVFWYLATYKNVEVEPVTVAVTTIGFLAVGLLGITYSVMSTSWDEDREGTLLGTDDFQRNVKNIQDGLSRSKENTLIREKMAGMDEREISEALADLERRESEQQEK